METLICEKEICVSYTTERYYLLSEIGEISEIKSMNQIENKQDNKFIQKYNIFKFTAFYLLWNTMSESAKEFKLRVSKFVNSTLIHIQNESSSKLHSNEHNQNSFVFVVEILISKYAINQVTNNDNNKHQSKLHDTIDEIIGKTLVDLVKSYPIFQSVHFGISDRISSTIALEAAYNWFTSLSSLLQAHHNSIVDIASNNNTNAETNTTEHSTLPHNTFIPFSDRKSKLFQIISQDETDFIGHAPSSYKEDKTHLYNPKHSEITSENVQPTTETENTTSVHCKSITVTNTDENTDVKEHGICDAESNVFQLHYYYPPYPFTHTKYQDLNKSLIQKVLIVHPDLLYKDYNFTDKNIITSEINMTVEERNYILLFLFITVPFIAIFIKFYF